MRRLTFTRWLRSLFTPRSRRRALPPRSRSRHLGLTALEPRETPAFLGGVNIAVGDVNGDGFPDLVASQASNGAPLVRVIDGQTGKLATEFNAYESTFTGGVYVACGDLDGDGRAEIVTGTGNGGGPNVSVFDGTTGKPLYSFFPYENSFRGGVIVAAADTDGDGEAEIITGTGVGGGPRVQVIDPATKQAVANFFAYESTFRGGVLVGSGDLTGDGKAEIITGTGVGGGPRVQAFDAASLNPVLNFFAYENTFRGGVLVGGGDTDGDGRAEVITGTGPGGGPVVTVFDGLDAQQKSRFLAFDGANRGGVGVAGMELNGDGRAEIICGAGRGSNPDVNVFSFDGAQKLLSLSPFDPVRMPTGPISVASSPTVSDPTTAPPPVGLTVSADRVMVGVNQQLVFTANAGTTDTPSQVQLYTSDSKGTVGSFMLNLFDDGDFTHRDPFANDRAFNNVVTVNYAAAGDQYYLARVTVGGATQDYTVKVTAVATLTDAASSAATSQMTASQTQLNTLLAQGTSLADALTQVQSKLATDPLVAPGSLTVTPRGVYWQTTTGISQGVVGTLRRGGSELDGPSGSSSDLSGSSDLAATADCKGKALLLAPFVWDVGQVGMNTISNAFQNKGWDVDYQSNGTENAGVVNVEDFKNLSQYDAVFITTHGDRTAATGNSTVILTGQPVSAASDKTYAADMVAGRVQKVAGYYAVTPSFFAYYSGQMNGTVVYIAACRSAQDNALGRTFLNLGAASYSGYSDYVGVGFAENHTISTADHLLTGGTVGTIDGVGDTETDADPARFRLFRRTANVNATMTGHCDLLKDYNLVVRYTWPSNQKDLDTGTQFLGLTSGWSCDNSSPYLAWSGDDTSSGGQETVTVKLFDAFAAGKWTGSVPVNLHAGWYSPAGGKGPATVTVALVNKTTGVQRGATQRSISPGSQSSCATTDVGVVTVTASSTAGSERVTFALV